MDTTRVPPFGVKAGKTNLGASKELALCDHNDVSKCKKAKESQSQRLGPGYNSRTEKGGLQGEAMSLPNVA